MTVEVSFTLSIASSFSIFFLFAGDSPSPISSSMIS